MNQYFIQPEAQNPPQDILLDHLLPRPSKPARRFSAARTPEEVAAIIAQEMLESVKNAFDLTVSHHTAHQVQIDIASM